MIKTNAAVVAAPVIGGLLVCQAMPSCRDGLAQGAAALGNWMFNDGASGEQNSDQGAKADREQRPGGLPAGTRPIDKDRRLDRGLIHDIKKGLGAKDWVGIDPAGDVWINEGGQAAQWGNISDWDRSDKRR
jgi:hypothetical protein